MKRPPRPIFLPYTYVMLVMARWLCYQGNFKFASGMVAPTVPNPKTFACHQQMMSHAKIFNKDNANKIPYGNSKSSQQSQEPTSTYEKNRKLLAKIFIVWSVVLILLLLNVMGVL